MLNQGSHHVLNKWIEKIDLDLKLSQITFFSFIPNRTLSAILEDLVKFRLKNPKSPIVFLSFISKKKIESIDKFGVLQLAGTEFIHLPRGKESIVKTLEKINKKLKSSDSNIYLTFQQNVYKYLIKEKLNELKHGQKFPIGNEALDPLLTTCRSILEDSENKFDFSLILSQNIGMLNLYLQNNEVNELLSWCLLFNNSNDQYLKMAYNFANQIQELTKNINDQTPIEIITKVENIYDYFNSLLYEKIY